MASDQLDQLQALWSAWCRACLGTLAFAALGKHWWALSECVAGEWGERTGPSRQLEWDDQCRRDA